MILKNNKDFINYLNCHPIFFYFTQNLYNVQYNFINN